MREAKIITLIRYIQKKIEVSRNFPREYPFIKRDNRNEVKKKI